MLKNIDPKMRQYIMIGGALGLYFGWFFRPAGEPAISIVFTLSAVIVVVMVAIWMWRGEREKIFRRAIQTYAKYVLILGILQGRHLALAMGGRPAVIAMTVIMGMVAGAWMSTNSDINMG